MLPAECIDPIQLPKRSRGLFALDLDQREFTLTDDFLEQYRTKPVNWGPVGYITYKRTYARFQDPEVGGAFRSTPVGESEEWYQTVARVVEGTYQIQQRHCAYNHVPFDLEKAQRSAQEMYYRIFNFLFTPPGRGLWMMGTQFIRHHGSAALNNCAFVSTEDIADEFSEPFTFLMDMSMLGVGVGSDCRGAGSVVICPPTFDGEYEIPDSREGWVTALTKVLEAYVGNGTIPKFCYDHIRPEGTPIKGFGGIAAGPEPLRKLLEEDIPKILDPLVGKPITSGAIVSLQNVVGKCVVSGNVRRSAEIMFGDPNDEEFLSLKDPELYPYEVNDHRWASNNSVFSVVGMDYTKPAAVTSSGVDMGYLWLDNVRKFGRMIDPPSWADKRAMGANPCVEQSLEPFELCCLVETYPARHDNFEEYARTLKFAYLYAKTVTLLPTHNLNTNRIMMRNRRIGVSQSGIIQNFQKIGFRAHMQWCDMGYQVLAQWDEIYHEWLAVPRSKKRTSVKPSGTVSKLCGSTAGIHYPCSEFYIQRIRFADNSPLLKALQDAGYPTEASFTEPNTTIVEIPVKEENFAKAESDVSMWEQLANAAAMQRYWADNQVSCTVKFDKETEGPHLGTALQRYEDQLKGISFLPHSHGFKQAPWEPISKEEYEKRIVGLKPMERVLGDTNDTVEKFCDGDTCQIPQA